MKFIKPLVVALLALPFFFLGQNVSAHRDGCHAQHSCPSDSGSYTCGDTGNCSECGDNLYCQGGAYGYYPPEPEPEPEPTPAPAQTTAPAVTSTPAPAPEVVEPVTPDKPFVQGEGTEIETTDTTPEFSGTAEPGATVSMFQLSKDGDAKLVTDIEVDEDGHWKLAVPGSKALSPGEYEFSFSSKVDGEESEQSDPITVTIKSEEPKKTSSSTSTPKTTASKSDSSGSGAAGAIAAIVLAGGGSYGIYRMFGKKRNRA